MKLNSITLKKKRKTEYTRMTFYNNYQSLTDVIKDYLHILIRRYQEECAKHDDIGNILGYNHIVFSNGLYSFIKCTIIKGG